MSELFVRRVFVDRQCTPQNRRDARRKEAKCMYKYLLENVAV